MPVLVQIAIIVGSILAMIKIFVFPDTTPILEVHNQSKQIQEEFESKIETTLQGRGYNSAKIIWRSHGKNYSTGCVKITYTSKLRAVTGDDYSTKQFEYINDNGNLELKGILSCNRLWRSL